MIRARALLTQMSCPCAISHTSHTVAAVARVPGGGRVVGVVSHVAEMRDRIPTQLRVTKSRGGSTIALAQ